MSELANILSKAQTIEPYEPTIRDNLRNGLRGLLGGGRGAQDFSDRLVGTELPKTPLGGLFDMVPGVSTAMDVQEGSRAWDQGRKVDAALHLAGPALDATGLGLALNSPGGRRAVGNWARDELGAVGWTKDASDIFGSGAKTTRYVDEATEGTMDVVSRPEGPSSVLELLVPEANRGQGGGKRLLAEAMAANPKLQGQVSSKAAATNAYKAGRRPYGNPNATLQEVFDLIDENSSVNLITQ